MRIPVTAEWSVSARGHAMEVRTHLLLAEEAREQLRNGETHVQDENTKRVYESLERKRKAW